MAIAFVTPTSGGTMANGTSSLAIPYPQPVTAGNLLICCIANKYPTNGPSVPGGGWNTITNGQGNGGAGSAGIDIGTVYSTIFWKISTGLESGNLAVTITGGNSAVGRIFQYSKAANKSWGLAACNGADNSAGTAWSVTGNVNPGITAGDVVIACSAINTDGYTYSSEAIAATGITVWGSMAERNDAGTNSGQDCGMVVSEHPVTTGTASDVPTFTMTANSSGTNNPAGATVMLRLHELNAYTLDMATGAGTITGKAITFQRALKFTMATGAGTITGKAVSLQRHLLFTLAKGTGTITGKDITFSKGYSIILSAGVGTISGKAITFQRALKFNLATGTGTITGIAAGLAAARKLNLATGAGTITGQPITFQRSLKFTLSTGAGTITGNEIVFQRSLKFNLSAGAGTITGRDITFARSLIFNLSNGAGIITGNDVGLIYTPIFAGNVINLETGVGTITGNPIAFIVHRVLRLDAGVGTITGQPVALIAARKMNLATGVGIISGKNVILTWNPAFPIVREIFEVKSRMSDSETLHSIMQDIVSVPSVMKDSIELKSKLY